MEIRIEPQLQELLRPLSQDERDELRLSLQDYGQKEPIDLWFQKPGIGTILDGHNRYSLLLELGFRPEDIKVRVVDPEPGSLEEAQVWMIRKQFGRRNLSDDQRKALAALLYEKRSEIARTDQLRRARLGQKGLGVNESLRSQVAKQAGVSEKQLRPAIKLVQQAPDLNAKVVSGEMTLRQASQELNERQEPPDIIPVEGTPVGMGANSLPSEPALQVRDFELQRATARLQAARQWITDLQILVTEVSPKDRVWPYMDPSQRERWEKLMETRP
jgi:ParB-like chromosome segregation protein Spo0J